MTGLEQIALTALPDAVKEGEKELAKGLAALLSRVYDDALSPGAKQLGGAIEDLVKTVRLLAWPLQMGAALQDRFRADLFKAIERVPEDRRTPPPLKLFADVCEGSKFETEDVLREMWSQLLSRGCDKERGGEAHPAFPGIVKQLSADEAKILQAFVSLQPRPEPSADPIPVVSTQAIGLAHPGNLSFYIGHLGTMGLTVQPFGFEPTGHVVLIDDVRTYMLSDYGKTFVKAVSRTVEATQQQPR